MLSPKEECFSFNFFISCGTFLYGERRRLRSAAQGLFYLADGNVFVQRRRDFFIGRRDKSASPISRRRALAVDYWQIMPVGALRGISLCMASLFSALCSNYTRSGRPVKRSGIDTARNGRHKTLPDRGRERGRGLSQGQRSLPRSGPPTDEFSHKTFTGQT